MSDLFSFGRAVNSGEGDYGLSGDMKKTQYVLQLLGSPANTDTLKCLITAVEVGLETDSASLDMARQQHLSEEYLSVSPFGLIPTLKEANYFVSGNLGVMSYIEARGLGKRLLPRNVSLLAEQNYWSDIVCYDVQPHVEALLKQSLLMDEVDDAVIKQTREFLSAPLDALDEQLADREFIVGEYSFADIHLTACVHLLVVANESELISQRCRLQAWFERIKQHKSFCGQNIVAYELLPDADDIKNQRLNSVVISDY